MLLEIICIQCVNRACPRTCEWRMGEKISLDSLFLHFFCMLHLPPHLLTDILDHSIQIWSFSETLFFQGFVLIREPYIVHSAQNDSPGCNPSSPSQSQDIHPSLCLSLHLIIHLAVRSSDHAVLLLTVQMIKAEDVEVMMSWPFFLCLSISRSWSCVDSCINSISSSYCSFRPTANSSAKWTPSREKQRFVSAVFPCIIQSCNSVFYVRPLSYHLLTFMSF